MPDSADLFAAFLAELQTLPSSTRLEQADTEAIYALAYQQLLRGDFQTAYRFFSLLTLYRPTDVKYLAGLAMSCKTLRAYDAAIGVYAFMALIEPTEPQHQLSIAECLLHQGATEDARQTLAVVQRFCAAYSGHERAAARAQAITSLLAPTEHAH